MGIMGVDAIISAQGDLTIDHDSPWFDGSIETGNESAYYDTNERYYGPEYPRGDWPTIYTQIRKLQSVFPRARVHYGSDHDDPDDPGNECTSEYLEEMWQHYLKHGHQEPRTARYAPGISAVIYARVPDSIKDSVDAYAEHWGLTIARAVADLLDIGLGGTPRQPVYARLAEIEERLDKLERA